MKNIANTSIWGPTTRAVSNKWGCLPANLPKMDQNNEKGMSAIKSKETSQSSGTKVKYSPKGLGFKSYYRKI